MATTISGKLINGIGEPIKNCKITLKSISTSTTVIAHTTASQTPSAAGDYSLSVEPGKYKVTLCVDGFPPEYVGDIQVYKDSLDGTLNHFLGLPQDNDLRPDAIKHFEAMVDKVASQVAEVEKSKLAAEGSARSAAASADRASQITGLSTVTDAISMASVPLPDVWIPFNDSLQMITGYGEEIKVGGVTVAKIVPFSRATTATYIDKSGNMRIAGINEPRFERSGLLIEGQSTNLLPWGEIKVESGTPTSWAMNGPITSTDKGPGIFTKIVPSGRNTGWYIAPGSILEIGSTYTISFWAYADNATSSVNIGVEKESALINNVTTTPTRYSLTFVAKQTSGTVVAYGGIGNLVPFYVGGFQLERSPLATSYIPTKGSAMTRSADIVCVNIVNNYASAFVGRTISFNFDTYVLNQSKWYPPLVAESISIPKEQIFFDSGLSRIGVDFKKGELPTDGSSSASVSCDGSGIVVSTIKNDGSFTCVNGVVAISSNSGEREPIFSDKVYLGCFEGRYSLFGHLRNVRIWCGSRALNQEQARGLK